MSFLIAREKSSSHDSNICCTMILPIIFLECAKYLHIIVLRSRNRVFTSTRHDVAHYEGQMILDAAYPRLVDLNTSRLQKKKSIYVLVINKKLLGLDDLGGLHMHFSHSHRSCGYFYAPFVMVIPRYLVLT